MVEVVVVLAEALAVVRSQQHHRPLYRPRGLERVHQPAHLPIHGRDLSIVLRDVVAEAILAAHRPPLRDTAVEIGHRPEARPRRRRGVQERPVERRGRRVRGMRVDVMQPEEERPVRRRAAHERDAAVGDRAHAVGLGGEGRLLPRLAVAVEALGVAVLRRDVGVVHDGGRRVAGVLQDAGQRRVEVEQDGMGLAVSVARRRAAGQHDRHAPARLRPVRVGALEHGARAGETVDAGAGGTLVAVGPEMVGPQRVDRHQQDVVPVAGRRRRAGAGRGPPLPTRRKERGARQEQGNRGRPPHAASFSIRTRRASSPACSSVTRTASAGSQGCAESRSAHSMASTPRGPGSSSSPSSRSACPPPSR